MHEKKKIGSLTTVWICASKRYTDDRKRKRIVLCCTDRSPTHNRCIAFVSHLNEHIYNAFYTYAELQPNNKVSKQLARHILCYGYGFVALILLAQVIQSVCVCVKQYRHSPYKNFYFIAGTDQIQHCFANFTAPMKHTNEQTKNANLSRIYFCNLSQLILNSILCIFVGYMPHSGE